MIPEHLHMTGLYSIDDFTTLPLFSISPLAPALAWTVSYLASFDHSLLAYAALSKDENMNLQHLPNLLYTHQELFAGPVPTFHHHCGLEYG